ncbi:hypothetical protein GCM10023172_21000 [Hymenobacter ginsengisoli]|uniref:DUF6970 domain-containing protein n=1 Tax=Hymenobacter ginsengisoli TaxID=1051626 RepID=A0ABP8QEE6_9BACT
MLLSLPLVAFQCGKKEAATPTAPCPGNPDALARKIAELQAKPKGNPAYAIWAYTWNGQQVYLASDQTCCDQYLTLYDACFNPLCAPSGGISGKGDGRCPDFYQQATNQQLVWRDPR